MASLLIATSGLGNETSTRDTSAYEISMERSSAFTNDSCLAIAPNGGFR